MAVVTFKDIKRTTQQVQQNHIELVKQDLLNNFNIRKGEKLENPNFGTNLWNYLFDPLDADTKDAVIREVEAVINYDPRVALDQLEVFEAENGLQVKITVLYIGYAIGETLNLLFDSEQGLLQGPGQVFNSSQANY